jgi:hypothetical protein
MVDTAKRDRGLVAHLAPKGRMLGKPEVVRSAGRRPQTKPLTSAQIRAGRALLRWSAEDLARKSALGINTIRRAELAEGETSMTAANDLAIRRALEAAGVAFIDENGGGPGVRLRKRKVPQVIRSTKVEASE